MNLIYVADPMCSWCYGFGKTLSDLQGAPAEGEQFALTLVMGGLRPYTTQPMDAAKAAEIFNHWQHVHEASGQLFAQAPHTALHEPGFVYDTEPASRATVTVRQLWPQHAMSYFKAVQKAFYADGKNVTRADVLANLAEQQGLPRGEFEAAFASAEMASATRQDFAQSQAWGIRGFPAVIAEHGGQLHLACNGYAPVEVLRQRLAALPALQH